MSKRVWGKYGDPYLIARKEAMRTGKRVYYTGEPCGRGHLYWRAVSDRGCLECARENAAANRPAPTLVYGDDMTRFMSYVEPIPESGCWVMHGKTVGMGYGTFSSNRKTVRAHRWAYEAFVGPIPDGLCVCHKCDVPCCVNPDHLFLGTHKRNLDDMTRKGRRAKGARMAAAKLTEEQAAEILAADLSRHGARAQLARDYGVSRKVIYNILQSKSWTHVERP